MEDWRDALSSDKILPPFPLLMYTNFFFVFSFLKIQYKDYVQEGIIFCNNFGNVNKKQLLSLWSIPLFIDKQVFPSILYSMLMSNFWAYTYWTFLTNYVWNASIYSFIYNSNTYSKG